MSLTSVSVILGTQREPDALEHVASNICSYLGPPPCLSLRQACCFGSTKLLDWIWDSSCTSPTNRPSKWSLHNFLRSDPHYYRDQFSKSVEIAARNEDFAIIKWLFTHFSGCEVSGLILSILVRAGNLEIMQFLWTHGCQDVDRNKKRKVETSEGIKTQTVTQSGNLVRWSEDLIMNALENDQVEVVRWLHEHIPLKIKERDIDREIRYSLRNGDEIAKILMPKGRCVLDYPTCSSVEMIELLLDCGYIRRNISLANSAIESLAHLGRLDLMQQVVLLHSPPCQNSPMCLHAWWNAITTACERGEVAMLQWLFDHPLGMELRGNMIANQKYSFLIRLAGQCDQAGVMQYLYEQGGVHELNDGIIKQYARQLPIAVRDDRYNTVKWLVEHIPFANRGLPGDMIIDIVARCRRFNILKLFHELGSSGVIDLTHKEDNPAHQVVSWWSRSRSVMDHAAGSGQIDMFNWLLSNHPSKITKDAMDRAACCGHLEMVQWLHANRSEGCSKNAIDEAASRGHIDIVKWLHVHRSEGCTKAAMDGAAGNGHLDLVKWLHVNRSEGCTKKAMDKAACNGHLNVVKWLAANRSEGCSAEAIQQAVNNGQVGISNWLLDHFGDYSPTVINTWVGRQNMFEVLLFLHEHFPHVITSEFRTDLCWFNINQGASAWLRDNYPSS